MDESIKRLVADVGIKGATAKTAVGIVLDFLPREEPADQIQFPVTKLPGAEAPIQKVAREGGRMGGVMDAGIRVRTVGLSMGRPHNLTRQFIAFAREKIGDQSARDRRGDTGPLVVCLS